MDDHLPEASPVLVAEPVAPVQPERDPKPASLDDQRVAEPSSDGHNAAVAEVRPICTPAQLRRFIKSRAYVPLHEIRRRFSIATEDDDVTVIDVGSTRVFVGLPRRESQILGDLLRGGEVGYELQLDPLAPIVVGVYPMRPVSRA